MSYKNDKIKFYVISNTGGSFQPQTENISFCNISLDIFQLGINDTNFLKRNISSNARWAIYQMHIRLPANKRTTVTSHA